MFIFGQIAVRSFFGRSFCMTILFRDLLTFSVKKLTIIPTRSLFFPTLALSSHQHIVLLLADRISNSFEKWTYGYRYVFGE